MSAKEKVLVALTVLCSSEAIKLITHDLLTATTPCVLDRYTAASKPSSPR